ncbi:MAG: DUF4325 domain-containing protein [Chthoniobacterales bacterium]
MREILMREHFGSFLADGDLGNKFRFCEVEPLFNSLDQLVFDFQGVTNMSDSFANACFGTLAEEHSTVVLNKVRFRNCVHGIKQSLECAIGAGIKRHSQWAK